MQWDSDALWEKAKLFAARARREEQEGVLFPFWSILSLELLARAVVANVHPVLLADHREPANLLYVFGLGELKRPRSVPAHTVFRRCRQIVEDFTEADLNRALGLIELRNEELHSGGVPFEGLPTAAWLADYYRLCQLLLRALDRDLEDLFGEGQTSAAEQMIEAAAEQLVSETQKLVAKSRKSFRALTKAEKRERRESGAAWIAKQQRDSWAPHLLGKTVECPACKRPAWMTGEYVRSGEPMADEDAIVQEIVKIPTRLECRVCGLVVSGHGRLHAIGHGGVFTGQLREDPVSYFNIEFEPTEEDFARFFEPDYGNE